MKAAHQVCVVILALAATVLGISSAAADLKTLFTSPLTVFGEVRCSALNTGLVPILVEVSLFDSTSFEISPSFTEECRRLAPGRVCVVDGFFLINGPVYCKVVVLTGGADTVRGVMQGKEAGMGTESVITSEAR